MSARRCVVPDVVVEADAAVGADAGDDQVGSREVGGQVEVAGGRTVGAGGPDRGVRPLGGLDRGQVEGDRGDGAVVGDPGLPGDLDVDGAVGAHGVDGTDARTGIEHTKWRHCGETRWGCRGCCGWGHGRHAEPAEHAESEEKCTSETWSTAQHAWNATAGNRQEEMNVIPVIVLSSWA